MADDIPIATVCSVRECGYDECWLQDQIATIRAAYNSVNSNLSPARKKRVESRGGAVG